MSQITIKNIKDAVIKIDQLDDDSLERLSETYVLQQEVLIGYIMSSAIEYENDQLLDLLIYYYNIFSEAINKQGIEQGKVSEEEIDGFQEEYIAVLDEYMDTDDADLIGTFCNQPNMVSFLVSEIDMEDENGESLDEDTSTYLFIVGIAMIALLNRSIIDK